MKINVMKKKIYLRVFCALLAVYLLLMTGFSIFLLWQEKQAAGKELGIYTLQVSSGIWNILQDNMDSDGKIKDLAKVKRDLVGRTYFFSDDATALAVYSGDLKLLSYTGDYWLCSYTERSEGNKNYIAYGYLNPEEWFDKKEIKALQNYIYFQPNAKKRGNLAEYSLSLRGFWIDNEMIIPDKIIVTPMYANAFDEEGNISSGSGTENDQMIYDSGYKDTKGLPYFESGSILPASSYRGRSSKLHSVLLDKESQGRLPSIVQDKKRLEKAVEEPGNFTSLERVSPFTYRYYTAMPYQNTVTADEGDKLYSEAWTVTAREVNLLDRCRTVLLFMWLSCLLTFLTATLILSAQLYKTYREREAAENHRKETTRALAHDLKTPLSIISGYAQNLMENIRTEKREKYAAGIQTNVKRMDKIIREMLELSKLESGSIPMSLEEVSLGRVCADLTERYRSVCEEKSITLRLEGDAVLNLDASLMERVLDNFFVNALDHTPDGGLIGIGIKEGRLEFYNSGSSIPEDKTEEIWLPYTKIDSARGSKGSTGLGLSIAGSILNLYGFTYGAENQDGGVVFWFEFPVME